MIDLRSDTVTKPTPEMLAAMSSCEVGDDVYDEDPTVHRLEERVAELFGLEAALFMPTGSMANVIALSSLVSAGEEVLAESRSHILRAEMGAHGALTGLTSRTWWHPRGLIDRDAITELYAPAHPYLVRTAAIAVENTHNFAGGSIHSIEDLRWLRSFADAVGIGVHIDGARIWNAHVATSTPLAAYGQIADSMAVCLSKGLGAPIGSLTLGTRASIDEARIVRKRLGGGMRQVGILAAAGLHALEHHLDSLAEDHQNAQLLAQRLGEVCQLDQPQTNIVVLRVPGAAGIAASAATAGVLLNALGDNVVRLVTHRDLSRDQVIEAAEILLPIVQQALAH